MMVDGNGGWLSTSRSCSYGGYVYTALSVQHCSMCQDGIPMLAKCWPSKQGMALSWEFVSFRLIKASHAQRQDGASCCALPAHQQAQSKSHRALGVPHRIVAMSWLPENSSKLEKYETFGGGRLSAGRWVRW